LKKKKWRNFDVSIRFLPEKAVSENSLLRVSADVTTHTQTAGLSFVIVALYGGVDEIGTDICAEHIAGDTLSLHTLSARFTGPVNGTEVIYRPLRHHPEGVALVESCDTAIAIRGRQTAAEMEADIVIDGLDTNLITTVAHALHYAGFTARISILSTRAKHPDNICNRGRRGCGIELDISHDLRQRLLADVTVLDRLAGAIRCGLQSVLNDS
jgi:phage replication-related protein YjqB (UPF0714/DUF867 family)